MLRRHTKIYRSLLIKFTDIGFRSLVLKLFTWLNTLLQKVLLVRIERIKQTTSFKLVKFVDVLFRKRLISFSDMRTIYSISWKILKAFSPHSQAVFMCGLTIVVSLYYYKACKLADFQNPDYKV